MDTNNRSNLVPGSVEAAIVRDTDLILIDQMSMISEEVFKELNFQLSLHSKDDTKRILRPHFGGKHVVLFGDPAQLSSYGNSIVFSLPLFHSSDLPLQCEKLLLEMIQKKIYTPDCAALRQYLLDKAEICDAVDEFMLTAGRITTAEIVFKFTLYGLENRQQVPTTMRKTYKGAKVKGDGTWTAYSRNLDDSNAVFVLHQTNHFDVILPISQNVVSVKPVTLNLMYGLDVRGLYVDKYEG
ncbi:hypothetical protein FQR65_LT17386 [Abscondita terminalis]|nr:hypothetical protein FQR65_LT17386 [Abscondita terminalis]